MSELVPEQVCALRFASQAMSEPQPGAVEVVRRLVGLQAQERHSAVLAFRLRAAGITAADVEHALTGSREVVRTWCMRGTLHLLTTEDARWLLPLVGPRAIKQSRSRYKQLGLDEDTARRGIDLIRQALEAHTALTRPEIGDYLEANGVSPEGQRLHHLVRRAALEGIICHGAEREGTAAYVLFEAWLGGGLTVRDETLWGKLAHRYFAGYGPATLDDFTRWAGITKTQARGAIKQAADDLAAVEIAGEAGWLLTTHLNRLDALDPCTVLPVQLIPAYDPLLLGYAGRDWFVDEEYAREIHPGGGLIRPTVLNEGQAVGTWHLDRSRSPLRVTVSTQGAPPPQADVEDLARFLGEETELYI